jgi:hypothetical protein
MQPVLRKEPGLEVGLAQRLLCQIYNPFEIKQDFGRFC